MIFISLCVTLTEFRTNGNWGYNVPVHPGLSLLKSQPDNCHISSTLYNINSVDINIEAISALSSAHQLNNCSINNSTLKCFINDGASDDRAVKCCVSNHYRHNGRRRFVAVKDTETNNQCTYVCTYFGLIHVAF